MSRPILNYTVKELAGLIKSDGPGSDIQLLDVREGWEFDLCKISGSIHIPMGEIPSRVKELDPSRPVVCLCHHGIRSYQVAMYLKNREFEAVYNVEGGIDAWSREIDPQCALY